MKVSESPSANNSTIIQKHQQVIYEPITQGMSSQVSQYINNKLQSLDDDRRHQLKMIIQSKRQFFQKQEASEMIENEQKRRESLSNERACPAKQKIMQIQHQIFTKEINESEMFHNLCGQNSYNIIDELERAYNNQTFGHDNVTLMKQIPDDQASAAKTQDTNREQLVASQLDYSNFNDDHIHVINEEKDSSQGKIKTQQQSLIMDSSDQDITSQTRRVSKQKFNTQLQLRKKAALTKSVTQIHSPDDRQLKNSMIQNRQPTAPSNLSNLKKNYCNSGASTNRTQAKLIYKNNVNSKQNKFLYEKHKLRLNETIKETIRNELFDIVNNYDTLALVPEDEKMEDTILELNRVTHKSKGQIPTKQHVKIQEYSTTIEQSKMTFSSQKQSRSPSLQKKLNQTIRESREQAGVKQPSTNVNSKILKNIICNTESKVKRILQSNLGSKQGSLERGLMLSPCQNPNETINPEESNYQISVDQLKEDMIQALQGVNARNLAQFLKSKTAYNQQSDYELTYIFTLIVAMVDENIPLNNDKSDLLKKSIDDICKYLSNHGRVIYSLQKYRVLFERKDSILKQMSKFQLLKKFDERKDIIFEITDSSNPIFRFTTDTIEVLRELHKLNKRQINQENLKQTIQPKSIIQYESMSNFLSPQNLSSIKGNNFDSTQKRFNFITPYSSISQRQSPTKCSSVAHSPSKQDRNPSVQQQLLYQKQIAIQKSYKVQLDQSISIHQKTQQAKEREYEIAKLKMQQKYLLFQLDKQEKLKEEKKQKELENKYLKDQGEFNKNLRQGFTAKEEKDKFRERSIENKEFRRALRLKEQEEKIRMAQENSKKALEEYQFKQQLIKQEKEKQAEEFRRKKQEILINKAHQSENFLNSKEYELDEKLKSQFDEASYRFKKLDETENKIRRELETLKNIVKPRKPILSSS